MSKMRIAFRSEGGWWVAYYAKPDTMEDAFELGRIRMVVARIPACKQAFMDAMTLSLEEALRQTVGAKVKEWSVQTAPEHERSGNG